MQPTPNPSGFQTSTLSSVSCTSADACTAVGDSQANRQTPFRTLAEIWNGSAWTLQPTPNRSATVPNLLNGVSCGASQTCTAVGQTQNAAGVAATLILAGD